MPRSRTLQLRLIITEILKVLFYPSKRPTFYNFNRLLNQDNKVLLEEGTKYLQVVNLYPTRSENINHWPLFAYKLLDEPGPLETLDKTWHISRLEEGQEQLEDQVFIFIFSRWNTLDSNFNELIKFTRQEYRSAASRREENNYFRRVILNIREDENNRRTTN